MYGYSAILFLHIILENHICMYTEKCKNVYSRGMNYLKTGKTTPTNTKPKIFTDMSENNQNSHRNSRKGTVIKWVNLKNTYWPSKTSYIFNPSSSEAEAGGSF